MTELGYDPVYGARPLKRTIVNLIENPLAEKILAGAFSPGSVIHIDCEGGQLKISTYG